MRPQDITSYLFTEKNQHDKMQVFSRKVWNDEKVIGVDTQTDVDEYFINQSKSSHTHFNTTNISNHSLGSRISILPINKLFEVRIRGHICQDKYWWRRALLFEIFSCFPTGHFWCCREVFWFVWMPQETKYWNARINLPSVLQNQIRVTPFSQIQRQNNMKNILSQIFQF